MEPKRTRIVLSESARNFIAAEKALARKKVPYKKIERYRRIALQKIIKGFEQPLIVMNTYSKIGVPISAQEQSILEKNLKRLDHQIDAFLVRESAFLHTKAYEQNSKDRIKKCFALSKLIINGAMEIELKGIVEKGFTHKVFRKIQP